MITGALGVLSALANLVMSLTGAGRPPPDQLEQMPEQARAYFEYMDKGGPILAIIGLLGAAFIIFGALKMKNLESRGLALGAAIVAMLPCLSPCCCPLGIPIGIWALVVLNRPDVRGSFRS